MEQKKRKYFETRTTLKDWVSSGPHAKKNAQPAVAVTNAGKALVQAIESAPLGISSLTFLRFLSLLVASCHFLSLLVTSHHFSSLLITSRHFSLLLVASRHFSLLLVASCHFSSLLFASRHFLSLLVACSCVLSLVVASFANAIYSASYSNCAD